MSRFLLLVAIVSACGNKDERPRHYIEPTPLKGSAEVAAETHGRCEPLPFAASTPLPEASGAAWLEVDGRSVLVVTSDSGNDGAYAILDPDTGETIEQGKLPLGAAGEDIEGFAGLGDRIYGVTSSGWIRGWTRSKHGFELVHGPNPIGAVDLPDKRHGDRPPEGKGMVCGAKATNCGRNYEGLCLVDPAHAKGPCAGFVASKVDGHLYCLIDQNGAYAVKYDQRIAIARTGAVADCAFADDGTLWVGTNLFDLAQVYRIDGWDDPATAKVVPFAPIGIGFPEAIAVRGEVFYRLSDTGGAPSLLAKFRCTR